jgi:hypothetical protein
LIQAYARDAYALPGVETVYVDMAAGLTLYAVYRVSGDDTHARLATLSHVETQRFPTVAATFVMRDATQLRRLPVPATAVRISAEGVPLPRDERRLLTSGRLRAAQHEQQLAFGRATVVRLPAQPASADLAVGRDTSSEAAGDGFAVGDS